MSVNTELVARLLTPVNAAQPAGEDLRYDRRVDAIKEARREEIDLPRQPGEPPRKMADWPAVIASATSLLAEETKDLQLAAWLTEAMVNREGFSGLATGLEAIRGLLDEFWDTVHPVMEDDGDLEPRAGPLEWVGGRLVVPVRMAPWGTSKLNHLQYLSSREVPTEEAVEQNPDLRPRRDELIERGRPTPESVDAAIDAMNKAGVRGVLADVDAAIAALSSLEGTADARFGRDAPSFNPMRAALDEIRGFLAALLARKLETDPDPEVPVDEADGGEGAVADGAPLAAEPTSRADATQRLGVAARWLRQQEPTNPAPYLMLRGFRWGELRADAPHLDVKLLEAPPTATRTRLKTLLVDEKWPELLEQSEQLMATAQGRGWLDLQRYVLTALERLGGSYDAVATAVRGELRLLLADLPSLRSMTLMDDTPTANEETQSWLQSERLLDSRDPSSSDATLAGAPDESSDDAEVLVDALHHDVATATQGGFAGTRGARRNGTRDVFDLARGELGAGRARRAIELLMTELARDQSARGRFVRQTQIAYIMVEGGLDAVAQPILERLVEVIDERTLEGWESGPLVAQPLALLCRVLDRTGGDQDVRSSLYLRVCRLDPLQALALQAR